MKPASEKRSKPSLLSRSIRTGATSPCRKEKERDGEVREQLAGIWEISPDKITVHIEGENEAAMNKRTWIES
ncbi:hypothetical protein PO124_08725 [Bacillus licheniformis]|nr:hypothetical protein [Bacillus licheniformis]